MWFIINSERDDQILFLDNFIDLIEKENHYYKCIDNCGGQAILWEESNVIMSKMHGHP